MKHALHLAEEATEVAHAALKIARKGRSKHRDTRLIDEMLDYDEQARKLFEDYPELETMFFKRLNRRAR
jgi:hypothetical protein